MNSYIIGIDYSSIYARDKSMFTVAKRQKDGSVLVMESGEIKDLDLSKYTPFIQVVGEFKDLEKFKGEFGLI